MQKRLLPGESVDIESDPTPRTTVMMTTLNAAAIAPFALGISRKSMVN